MIRYVCVVRLNQKYNTMKRFLTLPETLLSIMFVSSMMILSSAQAVFGQTYMFDDFNYSSVDDAQIPAFNKWNVVQGVSGPPDGAVYSKNNIAFVADPASSANKLMALSTTVNGASKATTHSRLETDGFDYFEGTYAARVYFSDVPNTYKDANIQTFYTIVSSDLGTDGSKYSEIDFEYMASDQWGTATNKPVLYMTSWNRYINDPWQAWKRYFTSQKSWAGWHTCLVSCTDKVNVKFYMDGTLIGSMSVTDNDGTSVYPRSPMQIAFANWIWNDQIGTSATSRNTTMQVDWVLFYKDVEKTPAQVDALVTDYRTKGVRRHNLAGKDFIETTTADVEITLDKRELELYPNPSADGIFHLSENVAAVTVRNLQSKVVATFANTDLLDLTQVSSGMYFAETGTNTFKIIKK